MHSPDLSIFAYPFPRPTSQAPVHIAIYTLVELWKRDPAAAYALADASRLSAQKETK